MSLHNFTGDRQDWRRFDRQQLGEPDPNFYADRCQGCDSELDDGFCRPCSTPAEIAERQRAKIQRDAKRCAAVEGRRRAYQEAAE